ncbi:MAG: DUF1700 domain-containing protein, partial [Clostridia bacterium]|nr:DUF1700 domain-containing protein [Clostridia bacterium]
MTGSAFFKRLSFQLDFLTEEERRTVIQYYRQILSFANTISEEEEIVKSFGSPERICAKLKEAVAMREKAEEAAREKAKKIDLDADDVGRDPDEPKTESEDLASLPTAEADPEAAPPTDEDLTSLPTAEADPEVIPANDEDLTSIPAVEKTSSFEESDPQDPNITNPAGEDVIFSKPPVEEQAPEIVHAMEDRESFNLYGEKVAVFSDEISAPPLPEEDDDLSPEELEEAKAKALEKAERYDADAFGAAPEPARPAEEDATENDPASQPESPVREDAPADEDPAAAESEDQADDEAEDEVLDEEDNATTPYPEDDDEEPVVTREYEGLFKKVFPSADEKTLLVWKILFSVLFSPLLLLAFGSVVALYLISSAVLIALSVILFVLMAALIIGGVVELVYGVVQLFSSVPAGLIEIGLGLIVFGVVTAAVALIYELLFGVVPKALKGLWKLVRKTL